MASPKLSNRTAKLYKTTYSCASPLTKLTLSEKFQDLPGLTVLLCLTQSSDPQWDHSRLQRCESNTRDTCGREVKGHKDPHNWKIQWLYSSLDHHQFGKTFVVLPSEEELVMLSRLLLKLGKIQSDSGGCCGMPQCLLEGLPVGRGWKALFITWPLAWDWT